MVDSFVWCAMFIIKLRVSLRFVLGISRSLRAWRSISILIARLVDSQKPSMSFLGVLPQTVPFVVRLDKFLVGSHCQAVTFLKCSSNLASGIGERSRKQTRIDADPRTVFFERLEHTLQEQHRVLQVLLLSFSRQEVHFEEYLLQILHLSVSQVFLAIYRRSFGSST